MTPEGDGARPTSIELRSRLGAIRDQGLRPTCLAFAASAAHEATRGVSEYLSVEALHAFAKSRDGEPGEGTTIDAVVAALEFDGQCRELDWPYGQSSLTNQAADFFQAGSARRTDDPLSFTLDSLAAGRVVVVALTLTEAWLHPGPDGRIRPPEPNDAHLGGHAVAATGYDEDGQYLTVRNSWGGQWGDGGYGRLSYESFLRFVHEVFTVRSAET